MTTNISKQSIVKMSWPIFVEVFLQMLVSNVDQFMISQYSQDSVGAIGNGVQVMNIIIILLTVMSTATTILIAQYLGAKNQEKISETCAVSLLINGVFSLIASTLLLLFNQELFVWMQVPTEILADTCTYLRIVAYGILFQGLYFSFVACFRGYSLMKTTMGVSIVMNLFNILGNWILIYGFWIIPPMGVAGVAISTNISKILGLIIIFILFKKYLGIKISKQHLFPLPWNLIKRMLSISIPTGGEALSYQLSQTTIMKMVNVFGLVVITTKVYVYIIVMFAYMYSLAISAAMQIVVGYLVGADKFNEVTQKVWYTVRIALIVGTGITSIFYLCSDTIFSIFTNDPEVLALGKTILFIEIFLETGRAVNIVLVRALQASGDIKTPVSVGIICMWTIAVGCAYFFGIVMEMGLAGIWIGMMLDECIRAIIFIYRWKSGAWRTKKLV